MKILIVGGNGTIGKAVVSCFAENNEVIIAGRTKGNVIIDITKSDSILKMFETVGKVDAIICAAGTVKWAPFSDLSEDDFYIGIKSKMMGQVNLVRIGQKYLTQGGSITLTTGILADDPVYKTTGAALVNGGLNSFVKAVSRELENGIRINVVSPGMVKDSEERIGHLFPGHNAVLMNLVAKGYEKSVLGRITGEVIRIY